MSFLYEKQSRRFFLCIVMLSICMLAFGVLLCMIQTQFSKEMLLQNDRTIASSLLEQHVAPDVIATALSNTKESSDGQALLIKIGFTEKTASCFF